MESGRYEQRLAYDLDALPGLQLSYAYTAPARLGARLPAFVEAAGAARLDAAPSGRGERVTTPEVILARRPAPSRTA
ncbi:hypothetical protein DMH01_42270 [Amycolatopsis sp. WAC 04182]|nr:hypothetical protein DMH01_42270 [Amycolatopsis sp. WAC 04182]